MTDEQLNAVLNAITSAGQISYVDITTMVATVVLAACAIIALAYAKGQLDEIVNANQSAAKTEKARFLFSLDEMFESPHFALSRAAFVEEEEKIMAQVRLSHKAQSADQQSAVANARFTEVLFELMYTDTEKYTKVMKLCGFFETLEVLIKNGFVDEEHVIDLYRPAILSVSDACTAHIKKRREINPEGDRALYENFLSLASRAR